MIFFIFCHFNQEEDSTTRLQQTQTSKMLFKVLALVLLVQLTTANPAINAGINTNCFYSTSSRSIKDNYIS
jgi:hypothetical protein